MDLLQLIQKLVADPEELAAFKTEGEAYIARQHPSLWPYLRSLLLQHHYLETGTVMSIKSRQLFYRNEVAGTAQTDAAHGPPKRIDLARTYVVLRTRTPFFAEHSATPQPGSLDPWPGYVCTLLGHSYAHAVQYGSDWIVNFTLNLSFVDPRNKADQPQILTLQCGDENYQPPNYNLGDTSVFLDIGEQQYILLRGARDFVVKLGRNSYYDTETHAICLIFDDPPQVRVP